MPHFLSIIKGVHFELTSVFIMLMLRTLEWFNFITMISFVSSLLTVLGHDLRKNNMNILLLQMAKKSKFLIKPMLLLGVFYSMFFVFIDGVCVPRANLYLKQKLVELAKDKLIASIQPRNIVPYKEFSFTTQARIGDEELYGVLLNKESDPEITILVRKMHFDNRQALHLSLKDGIGKIASGDHTIMLRFKKGVFVGPSSMVRANKTIRNETIFELEYGQELLRRFLMALVALIVPFFVFVRLFGSIFDLSLACLGYLVMLFYAVEIILPFNIYGYCFSALIVYLIYRKVLKNTQKLGGVQS